MIIYFKYLIRHTWHSGCQLSSHKFRRDSHSKLLFHFHQHVHLAKVDPIYKYINLIVTILHAFKIQINRKLSIITGLADMLKWEPANSWRSVAFPSTSILGLDWARQIEKIMVQMTQRIDILNGEVKSLALL